MDTGHVQIFEIGSTFELQRADGTAGIECQYSHYPATVFLLLTLAAVTAAVIVVTLVTAAVAVAAAVVVLLFSLK